MTGAPTSIKLRVHKGRLLAGLELVPGTRTVRCHRLPPEDRAGSVISTLKVEEVEIPWAEYRALPVAEYVLVAVGR